MVDRIWLATGTKLDIAAEPMFKEMLETHPLEIVNGLPVLDKHLRWPGCELFLTGGLAALQVGPVARNLSGARMACDRFVSAIVKSSIALSPAIISQQSLVISDTNSGCTPAELLTVDCRRRGGKTQWLSVNC